MEINNVRSRFSMILGLMLCIIFSSIFIFWANPGRPALKDHLCSPTCMAGCGAGIMPHRILLLEEMQFHNSITGVMRCLAPTGCSLQKSCGRACTNGRIGVRSRSSQIVAREDRLEIDPGTLVMGHHHFHQVILFIAQNESNIYLCQC
jgi:hypothetical protein